MKNFKLLFSVAFLLIFFLNNNRVDAQIYAKNAYLFVADNYIFSKGNINLDTGSNIFLRNESQLLQGTTTSTNTGTGTLSVFQEGAASSYWYNYWCSPISLATGGVIGNETFGIPLLGRPNSLTTSTPATFIHDTSYNGTSNPLNIEPYFIWKYINSSVYAPNAGGWQSVNTSTTSLNAGEGFSMKGTSGIDNFKADGVVENNYDGNHQRYDFAGKPNDGDVVIPIANDKVTLTGNPYPSAIDLSMFLTNETNCTGIAYFWDSNPAVSSHFRNASQGGYGTYSPVSRGGTGIYVPAPYFKYTNSGAQNGVSTGSGLAYERYFTPIGQGFMIIGKSAPSPTLVTMKNNYRVFKKEGVANQSEFHRVSATNAQNTHIAATPSVSGFDYTTVSLLPTPQINIKADINDNWISNAVLGFDPNATDNIDHAMDAKTSNNTNPNDISFAVANDNCVINIINFDINKKVPLVLKNAAQADFKIKIQEMLNFYDADHVYVHDKDNDTYHEITTTDSYDVTMPAGENRTRFEITFTATSALSTDVITLHDFDILQNNFTKNLVINNPKSIALKEISIYDISGKLIFNKSKLGNDKTYQFSTSNFSDAIYAVRIGTDDGQVQGKKILVYNKEK